MRELQADSTYSQGAPLAIRHGRRTLEALRQPEYDAAVAGGEGAGPSLQ